MICRPPRRKLTVIAAPPPTALAPESTSILANRSFILTPLFVAIRRRHLGPTESFHAEQHRLVVPTPPTPPPTLPDDEWEYYYTSSEERSRALLSSRGAQDASIAAPGRWRRRVTGRTRTPGRALI